jgi:hypothetical protein
MNYKMVRHRTRELEEGSDDEKGSLPFPLEEIQFHICIWLVWFSHIWVRLIRYQCKISFSKMLFAFEHTNAVNIAVTWHWLLPKTRLLEWLQTRDRQRWLITRRRTRWRREISCRQMETQMSSEPKLTVINFSSYFTFIANIVLIFAFFLHTLYEWSPLMSSLLIL